MIKSALAIAFAAALLLVACVKNAERTEQSSNPEVPVSLLFEHDGCKVYRFKDGRNHYFTTCEGSVSSDWTTKQSKGGTTHHTQENQTIRRTDGK